MAKVSATLELDVDATKVSGAAEDLERLGSTAERTGKKTAGLGKSTAGVSKAFKLQKGAVQQAGYQIQDFAVQVSGGTSALVAFGQQGSQLAGILGPGGAVIGAVIAIGSALGGVLLRSLMGSGEATKQLKEEFDNLAGSIKNLTRVQAAWVSILKEDELSDAKGNVEDLTKEIGRLESLLITTSPLTLALFGDMLNKNLVKSKAKLELAKDSVERLTTDVEKLNNINSKGADDLARIGKAYQDYASLRLQGANAVAEAETGEAANEAFTSALLKRGNAEAAYLANKQNQYSNYWAAYGQAQLILSASEQNVLTKKLSDEAAYQSASLAGYQEYYATLVHHKEDEAAATVLAEKNKLTIQQSLNSVFSSLMAAQSKELFEIGKIGSIGSAINSAYEAINKTLAQGGMFAIPAATAIGAAAFANVASIASQKYGSKSSGGGSTPSIPSATPEATETTRSSNVNISLVGEVFNRETINQLIGGINEAVADGATVRLV